MATLLLTCVGNQWSVQALVNTATVIDKSGWLVNC